MQLAYRELGRGRPLILIHGYLGSAQSGWVDSGIAEKIAGHGYRVIMPDLRGHGDSAKPHDAAAYPPDVLANDGLALITAPPSIRRSSQRRSSASSKTAPRWAGRALVSLGRLDDPAEWIERYRRAWETAADAARLPAAALRPGRPVL